MSPSSVCGSAWPTRTCSTYIRVDGSVFGLSTIIGLSTTGEVIHVDSGSIGPNLDSSGEDGGPISIGRARRCTWRPMSMHTLVAMRYSHERTLALPSNRSAERQARSIVSCTASSASKPEPSIR